ncbi:Rhs element protein [Shigella sonnei]|uniref:type VI secretion system tip protein TssI/VgrG n=1 Tax=Shigella sonnei TaxID=624 RepID=UPI000972FFB5|nr:type VI secretion system tip protein TssI/VgrG [Shigella sonnei]SJE73123.1 Rhs element protein [Shigella sonnei]
MSTGLRFTLEVDGLPPDAFAVVSFHLNQSLSSLFSLDLSLVSQQFLSLEFAQVLDKMAYLTVWQGDDVQRRVKGVVTWFELGENDKNQMLYSMKVCPPLWRTGLRQNFRIFQNEDIESILATILKENGVTEWSPLFSEPHPSREFCVQYGETDYDFLCRMAAEEGIFFYEEHAQKSTDQSLVLCDTVRYLPESFEIPWNPNTRTEVSTLCISQFRYSAQIRPSSVVTKDYTFKRPGWPGRFDQEGQYQDYQRTQYEVYDYPGRFKGAHGQNFARWQMDGWRNNAEVARGTSRSPEIWPGRRIVLTGHPQANLNREWQVVASDLHGEQPQAVPGRRGSGTTLENHFAVIPADRTWRPQPLMKPLVDGPQSAVVTGPAGEEIFCDEHGRVRVKFNWDRYNPSNQDSSCWIRVAQAWAGTGFGNLAIPRVGQEVIVDFLNGDPDQPIIMGRTYHQENRTPGSLPGTKTQMTIRSKTYKGSGFNELKFDDATGKEQVYIHVQKNMNTEVLNNHFAVIPADRTWRPQPLLKPLVDGPQSAVVTGPAGEEIFCDEHGRVRVKFNWDRYNPSNQDSSCWIRVAQAWAGTGFGNLAIPRVGQEVIVDFLNGDPDQPIIMGRTYHQENRTPGSLPGTKTQMTIRSKTYKGSGFNELKFDDATGKEQVYIHVQKNMNTEVLNNRTTDVINNHAEKIGNNQAITVTNNQMQNGI